MERLTQWNDRLGRYTYKKSPEGRAWRKTMQALGAYEDTGLTPEQITELNDFEKTQCAKLLTQLQECQKAEEEGLFLRLPCKVGDAIYEIVGNSIFISSVIGFRYGRMISEDEYDFEEDYGDRTEEWHIEMECGGMSTSVPFSEIDNTVFITREEAEKKLSEREGNHAESH